MAIAAAGPETRPWVQSGLDPWFNPHIGPASRRAHEVIGAVVLPARSHERKRALRGKNLEPISKSSEEDDKAGELNEAEKVASVIFPADEDAPLPLYPGEEALDQPTSHVTA